MARFRLRFQLQEIDLAPGETMLGRSPECHVTIEDPLVSRLHARIRIDGEMAIAEDLGSRNGLRVNGARIGGPTSLTDGDRLRIGTQEFVFHRLSTEWDRAKAKSTGFLRYCASCRYPFPEEVPACPNCGHEETTETDESTLSGVLENKRPVWALQLLLELLDRALAIGRWDEAEEVLRRACAAVDEQLTAGGEIDADQFGAFLSSASRLSQSLQAPEWARWLMATCARIEQLPGADVVARLRTIPPRDGVQLLSAIEEVVKVAEKKESPLDPDVKEGVDALEQWQRELKSEG